MSNSILSFNACACFSLATILILSFCITECQSADTTVTLSKNFPEIVIDNIGKKEKLSIICYDGEKKSYYNLLRTVYFKPVGIKSPDYQLFPGKDEADVERSYRSHTESWFAFMPWPSDSVHVDLFNHSCVGVFAKSTFTARIEIKRVDYWKLFRLLAGIFCFFVAPKLSRNTCLHYLSGVSFGVCASILIFVYILSRFIPKKSGVITFMLGGWAVFLYLLQVLWTNLQLILNSYVNYFLTYIVCAGCLSFVFCYRYGPVTDHRTLNIIQWTIQILSLVTVFFSSENQEFSMAIVLFTLISYNFPVRWKYLVRAYWRRKFPPKIRLLSEEEYRDQMSKTTQAELNELRKFCRSPECNSWDVINRISQPLKFAAFVEGNSHLSDEEILDYETTERYTTLTSSESENES